MLSLVPSNDPILSERMPEFNFEERLISGWEVVQQLIEVLDAERGLGLSANQVGLHYRVFVVAGKPPIAFFNPKIIDIGEEEWYLEEGCLSWPGLFIKVKRPKTIQIRYQDADANFHTETFAGLSARVILHEYDHLNGICHIDRATRYHKDKAMKKWKKNSSQ